MIQLAILIPTIVGREKQLSKLIDSLNAQIGSYADIAVQIACDNKELSIGSKRQQLIDNCEAKYCVQIDDDDAVTYNYISTILNAIKSNPDCITYLESVDGNKIACHSNVFDKWANNLCGYQFVRTPFYKDVIRTEVVKAIGFNDLRYGEDHDFSIRLKQSGLIKTEVHINEVMYHYNSPGNMTPKQHKERYGIK